MPCPIALVRFGGEGFQHTAAVAGGSQVASTKVVYESGLIAWPGVS